MARHDLISLRVWCCRARDRVECAPFHFLHCSVCSQLLPRSQRELVRRGQGRPRRGSWSHQAAHDGTWPSSRRRRGQRCWRSQVLSACLLAQDGQSCRGLGPALSSACRCRCWLCGQATAAEESRSQGRQLCRFDCRFDVVSPHHSQEDPPSYSERRCWFRFGFGLELGLRPHLGSSSRHVGRSSHAAR